MPFEIEYICISHVGKHRSTNEDNFVCNFDYMPAQNSGTDEPVFGRVDASKMPLFGVFDGMGGEDCGEIAAYIAARGAANIMFADSPRQTLGEFCRAANAEICQYIVDTDYRSMGTTAAMLMFDKNHIHLCNLGDSKVYSFKDGVLKQLSCDHVADALQGKKPPLLQNLGIPENELRLTPYFLSERYGKDDIFLICSDGLSDMVSSARISDIFEAGGNLFRFAGELLESALEGGGRDNITIIICRVLKKPILGKIQNFLNGGDGNG